MKKITWLRDDEDNFKRFFLSSWSKWYVSFITAATAAKSGPLKWAAALEKSVCEVDTLNRINHHNPLTWLDVSHFINLINNWTFVIVRSIEEKRKVNTFACLIQLIK